MLLFDEITRDDMTPCGYAQSAFEYLNVSGRPEAQRVRDALEDWLRRYPENERHELCGRLRSDDIHHLAAFFELLLHELLLRLGCDVEVHPTVHAAGQEHLDFRANAPGGDSFYMEAVLVAGQSARDAAARSRMNDFLCALNQLRSPDFFIGIEIAGAPDKPLPASNIRAELAEHLQGLNPDEIMLRALGEGFDALPQWSYECHGCRITFFPIPKAPEQRGEVGDRIIALEIGEMHVVGSSEYVKEGIKRKGGRRSDFDLPYVIAVNVLGDSADRDDVMEVLFGEEQWEYRMTDSGLQGVRMTRAPSGAFRNQSGPRRTHVSAVLLTNGVTPWTFPTAGVRLYHHPRAQKRYESVLTCLPQAVPRDNVLEFVGGQSFSEVFSMAPLWPEI